MNDGLYFNTRVICNISEDAANVSHLLKNFMKCLEGVSVRNAIFLSKYSNKANDISTILSCSADLIAGYSKEFSGLKETLIDVAHVYEQVNQEVAEVISSLPDKLIISSENSKNYRSDFLFDNFDNSDDIRIRHISSNELIMPDWMMTAIAKFNVFSENLENSK